MWPYRQDIVPHPRRSPLARATSMLATAVDRPDQPRRLTGAGVSPGPGRPTHWLARQDASRLRDAGRVLPVVPHGLQTGPDGADTSGLDCAAFHRSRWSQERFRSEDGSIPPKLKGMHWRTYEAELDRCKAYLHGAAHEVKILPQISIAKGRRQRCGALIYALFAA